MLQFIGVANSQTRLNDWTTTTQDIYIYIPQNNKVGTWEDPKNVYWRSRCSRSILVHIFDFERYNKAVSIHQEYLCFAETWHHYIWKQYVPVLSCTNNKRWEYYFTCWVKNFVGELGRWLLQFNQGSTNCNFCLNWSFLEEYCSWQRGAWSYLGFIEVRLVRAGNVIT